MPDYGVLPECWSEVKYDVGEQLSDVEGTEELEAMWANEEEKIAVRARHTKDKNGIVKYVVNVEQTIEKEDGPGTTVQTYANVEDSRKMAERTAIEFMHEVNDGNHRLKLLGVERGEGEFDQFYQFYCVADDDLPDGMRAEELISSIDDETYDDDIEDVIEDEEGGDIEEAINIHVFPRHVKEVENGDT